MLTRRRPAAWRLIALAIAAAAALAVVLGATLSAAQAADPFRFTQYKVPTANSEPRYIAAGSDGNVWFTEGNEFFTPNPDPDTGGTFHTQIGRITPAGRITEFRVDGCQCFLNDIVQGPGGVLYVTTNSNLLVRITTAGDVLPFVETPFDVGGSLARSGDDLWTNGFVGNTGSIWRYDVPTGDFTEFPTGSTPLDVAVDAQGIVWFSGTDADGAGQIGRLDPATGAVTATPVAGSQGPGHIAVASDGKVWFTDRLSHTVGHLDPSDNDRVTQFATLTPEAGPQDIAAANDGSMWFAQARVGNVARITPDGTITEAGKAVKDDPRSGLESALGIAVRPEDQSVWYTKQAGNQVARLTPR